MTTEETEDTEWSERLPLQFFRVFSVFRGSQPCSRSERLSYLSYFALFRGCPAKPTVRLTAEVHSGRNGPTDEDLLRQTLACLFEGVA